MSHQPFTAICTKNQIVAADTHLLTFDFKAEPREFSVGQFFLFEAGEKAHRAYSIASAPSSLPSFELLIKIVPNGLASQQFKIMQVGDQATFRGPMGKYGLKHADKDKIFFATGTGLAPMRSFWRDLLPNSKRKIELFFGVSYLQDLCLIEEMQALEKQYPDRFKVHYCLSRETDLPKFAIKGRITDAARNLSPERSIDKEIALCGSRAMVNEIKEILTVAKVDKKMIQIESW